MALVACRSCGQAVSNWAKMCPWCGQPNPAPRLPGCIALIVIGLLVVAGLWINYKIGTARDAHTQIALSRAKLSYQWQKTDIKNLMQADFTVTNDSDYAIAFFEIQCEFLSTNGRMIDHRARTIYETVTAHTTKEFPKLNMGVIHAPASRAVCGITSLSIR